MAKKKSMTMEEALQVILASEGDNPFRQMLEFIVCNALELEMAEHLGASPYERTEERLGYRNGYKPRILTTAVGDLYLLIPQDRDGTFSTQLFERYQRSDKALVLSMMEMYLKGVSTRKVAAITEKLCGRAFSSQLVSKLSKELDEKLAEWRERDLEGEYPYLVVDARYEKVRVCAKVVSQGILICMGISAEGKREILTVRIADTESCATWSDLFRSLKKRGLKGVRMVTSDDHEGIKAAVARHLQGASWQRCQCHFVRNLLAYAPKGRKKELHAELRAIFDAPDLSVARRFLSETVNRWEVIRPEVADNLEGATDDVLSCFHFPSRHKKRIRTTNCVERLNEEIRRRTRVVRIFPNRESIIRLVGAVLAEQNDEWMISRRYMSLDVIGKAQEVSDRMEENELNESEEETMLIGQLTA